MKNLPLKLAITGILTLFTVVMAFNACTKHPLNPAACSVSGTFVNVPCGTGVFGNLWIRLDNNKLLQPCSMSIAGDFKPVEGQRVKLGYAMSNGGDACKDELITCMLAIPPRDRIKITCMELQPADNNGCTLTGTVRDYKSRGNDCGWLIEGDNGVSVEPYGIPSSFVLRDGMRVTYAYQQVYTFKATCMGSIGGQITCIKEIGSCRPLLITSTDNILQTTTIYSATVEGNCLKLDIGFSGCDNNTSRFDLCWDGSFLKNNQFSAKLVLRDKIDITCQAYFRTTLSFDLSKLKSAPSQTLRFSLAGWEPILTF